MEVRTSKTGEHPSFLCWHLPQQRRAMSSFSLSWAMVPGCMNTPTGPLRTSPLIPPIAAIQADLDLRHFVPQPEVRRGSEQSRLLTCLNRQAGEIAPLELGPREIAAGAVLGRAGAKRFDALRPCPAVTAPQPGRPSMQRTSQPSMYA